MALNLASVEAFYWSARLGTFRGAAQRLGITQPTVSYRIAELESELGVPLFNRRGRTIESTDHGDRLFAHAERLLAISQDIDAQVRVRGREAGLVRFGVPDSFAAIAMPTFLAEAERRFPAIRLGVTVDTSHALTSKLTTGDLDVAILSTPPDTAGIALAELGRQTVRWIGSATLPLPPGLIDLDQIRQQRIFSTPAPSNHHALIRDLIGPGDPGTLRIDVCNSVAMIASLVRAGVGISLLPLRLVDGDLASGALRVLDTTDPIPLQTVYIGRSRGLLNHAVPSIEALARRVARNVRFCDVAGES